MRHKGDFPAVDEHGRIELDSVNSLTYAGISQWIYAVLHAEGAAAGANRSEVPHGFLRRIYHRTDPRIRQCFEDALMGHLEDLARSGAPSWNSDEAIHELLLLIAGVFQDSPRRRAPISLLRYMADFESFRKDRVPNVHWRILQTLIALNHRLEPNFWENEFRRGGEGYADLALRGLFSWGVRDGFEWLYENASRPAVFSAFLRMLPRALERFGEAFQKHLHDLPSRLSEDQEQEFRRLTAALGIKSRDNSERSIFAQRDTAASLAGPPASMKIVAGGPSGATSLESDDSTFSQRLEVLKGAYSGLSRDPRYLSPDARTGLVEMAEGMMTTLELEEDSEWNLALLAAGIKYRGIERDVASKISRFAV